jgi:hypothetical protein
MRTGCSLDGNRSGALSGRQDTYAGDICGIRGGACGSRDRRRTSLSEGEPFAYEVNGGPAEAKIGKAIAGDSERSRSQG